MAGKQGYPPDFVAFWGEYPRPVGKPAAFRAWLASADDRPPLEAVIAAIRHQWVALGWAEKEVCFIPHPATWLNQHRWEDDGQKRKPPSLIAQQAAADGRRAAQQAESDAHHLQHLRGMHARHVRERGGQLAAVARSQGDARPVADLLGDLGNVLRRRSA